SLVFVFFFQAEDGIRDKLVTGVQTCALPILVEAAQVVALTMLRARLGADAAARLRLGLVMGLLEGGPSAVRTARQLNLEGHVLRSEERRVGKECRTRWSAGA